MMHVHTHAVGSAAGYLAYHNLLSENYQKGFVPEILLSMSEGLKYFKHITSIVINTKSMYQMQEKPSARKVTII